MSQQDHGECNQLERLERYSEKLESYGNRLTSLEMGQRHLAEVFDQAERRIMGVVSDLKEIVEDGFAALDKRLFVGNGKPSLDQRLAEVEKWMAREAGAEERSDKLWLKIQPWIPWITAMIGAAGMWFVKSAK